MKKRLLSLALSVTTLSAMAVQVDGIEYTLDNSALTATTTAELSGNGYQGDIVIPDEINAAGRTYKVIGIGQSSFEGNIITSIKIGNNVTSIGKWAFYGCANLTSVEFGTGIGNGIEIPPSAFQQSNAITTVKCNAEVPAYIYGSGFSDTVYSNATLYIPEGTKAAYCDIMSHNWHKFANVKTFTPGSTPDPGLVDVVNIGGLVYNLDHTDHTAMLAAACHVGANYDKTGYSGDVVIPEEVTANETTYTVTVVDSECFYQCYPTSIKFPETLESVGWESFYNISTLTSLTFPESVKTIEAGCFYNCANITEITLGSGMQTLGGNSQWVGYCFMNLNGLTTLTSLAETPPAAVEKTFQPAVKQHTVLKVPYGKAETYKNAPYWDGFKEYVELPDPTTGIGDIESDNNSPARYYNLQGIEVKNPTAGQLLIERRGTRSAKVVYHN